MSRIPNDVVVPILLAGGDPAWVEREPGLAKARPAESDREPSTPIGKSGRRAMLCVHGFNKTQRNRNKAGVCPCGGRDSR